MDIKLKDNPEKTGLLAGFVLLFLALGFMTYKVISIQGQVSSLNSQQKVLQTVPPSRQLTKEEVKLRAVSEKLSEPRPKWTEEFEKSILNKYKK